ncbi:hypothetical protein E2C01_029681 [Portunus trituberculatus]|uniref:Uncharacterized protein n=1 Tax=Portunus trituberculatus TaxID=210409 RepID=A0A5B7EPZ6_PORTR|nr:hypothetical protein [Portunus trituberculatus]
MLRKACYHDHGEIDDLEGLCTHHHNNNNSGAFAWATQHLQLTCTVCACLVIPIALSYCIFCSAAHTSEYSHRTALRSQLFVLGITTFDLPTLLAASGVHPSRQPAVLRVRGPNQQQKQACVSYFYIVVNNITI